MSNPEIQLRGLRLMCFCGALPEEKLRRQPYEFDTHVEADINAGTESDTPALRGLGVVRHR